MISSSDKGIAMIPMPSRPFTRFARRSVAGLLLLAMACGSVGCGLPVQFQKMANKLPVATPEDPVYYVLCIWQPSEGQGPDGQHTRGFAGQICFFTRRNETPVRANGDVRVYVYDDQGKPEDRGKPLHQWDFLGDAWQLHLHDGTLGPTYSVFIPYTRTGNHQVQCALRVKFTPEHGGPIYSDTTAVILPGPLRKKEDQPISQTQKTDSRTTLDTLTIPLKEKQKAMLADMPLGESKMERIVAPASDLARRSAAARNQTPIPPETPTLQTLPSAPAQTMPTPVIPVPPPQTLPAAADAAQALPLPSQSFPQVPVPQTNPAPATHPFGEENF